MTSVPPTQPPAAPETDVRLTEAPWPAAWPTAAELSDRLARVEADLDAARERVRVVEGERDVAQQVARSNARHFDQAIARTESAEAAHRALRAAVEALADEWEADFMAYRHDNPGHLRLRALLAGGEER